MEQEPRPAALQTQQGLALAATVSALACVVSDTRAGLGVAVFVCLAESVLAPAVFAIQTRRSGGSSRFRSCPPSRPRRGAAPQRNGAHPRNDGGARRVRPRWVCYARTVIRSLPESIRWVFWDVDFSTLDVEQHADAILARVLEEGRLEDVRVVLSIYGPERIHRFFREVAHPLISARTRAFWRAFFHAENEPWATLPAFRTSSAAPWID